MFYFLLMPVIRTNQLAIGIIALQALSWILVPLVTLPNAPLDVIEGAIWGRQFDLGYHKGPPLFAWLLGIGLQIMPGSVLPALVLSQLSLATAYWSVWRLTWRLFGETDALVVMLLMTTIYYYGFPSPEFNPIILQIAFSALVGSFLYTALREDRLREWLIVGAAAGLGMLSRYSMALYLLPMLLFVLLHPQARRCLARPGPYIAVAVACVIFLPHLLWVAQNDFISLAYIDQRAGTSTGWKRLTSPAYFIGGQILAFVPMLLILTIGSAAGMTADHERAEAECGLYDRWYIVTVALGPVALLIVTALVLGRTPRAMWGAPLWVFAPLLAMLLLGTKLNDRGRRRLYYVWPAAFLLPLLIFAGAMLVGPNLMNRNKRVHFPGQTLAAAVTDIWRQETGQRLSFIAGPLWVAGNAGFYSPDRPQIFTDADQQAAPWIDMTRLASCGAMIVWSATEEGDAMPAYLAQQFPAATASATLTLPPPLGALKNVQFRFGWALLPPQGDCPGSR